MNVNANEIKLHPFAAAIIYHLKDEEVELYCGDVKTTKLYFDYEKVQKNVIRCTIKDAMGDCLIVECKKRSGLATVFINVWSIKTIIRMRDPLFISDIFEDEATFLHDKLK